MEKCVYVFRQIGTDFYKIGYTESSVEERFKSMKMYSPIGAEITSIIHCDNPKVLESDLHKKFKDKRLSGEFFKLDELDIEIIKNYENEKFKDFMSKCALIYQECSNPNKLIKVLWSVKSKNDEIDSNKELFISIIIQNFGGTFAKPDDLYLVCLDHLGEEEKISLTRRAFGLFLAKAFMRKSKKIDGVLTRVYEIPEKLL